MDHDDFGWNRYVESLERRIESIEKKIDERFDKLDDKITPLTNFKNKTQGRNNVISAIIAGVVTLLTHIGLAIFKVKSGN